MEKSAENNVNEASFINDLRESVDFKTITFSGYKKTDVKKELLQALYKSKVENACHWCAELICAGHFTDIWEIILLFLGKYIHLGNPKLAIYIDKRFNVFKNIMAQGNFSDELQLRNNPTIRNIFSEICCVLCTSPKKPSIEALKINKVEEFDMTQISDRLKAPSISFAEPILKKEDPKEIAIAINEFSYHVSSADGHIPNMSTACYWIEWLISFDQICKKRKHHCIAETRDKIPVDHKYKKEIIWIIWDALFFYAKDDYLKTILNSILKLFCLKFTPASIKKRTYLLYFAVSIVTEPFNRTIPMIPNKDLLETTLTQIDSIYKQIKKSEVSPKTEYLFAGLHENQTNRQKSMQKLDILNSMHHLNPA
jgi:hypothetical protein